MDRRHPQRDPAQPARRGQGLVQPEREGHRGIQRFQAEAAAGHAQSDGAGYRRDARRGQPSRIRRPGRRARRFPRGCPFTVAHRARAVSRSGGSGSQGGGGQCRTAGAALPARLARGRRRRFRVRPSARGIRRGGGWRLHERSRRDAGLASTGAGCDAAVARLRDSPDDHARIVQGRRTAPSGEGPRGVAPCAAAPTGLLGSARAVRADSAAGRAEPPG
mmetsp:Transcript_2380/g.7970  ORF Transcript_2380/g.7970 Transcript_2380/m.7970 type:complete len:219 (+) Transcript_2380:501-1157(+)